MTNALCESTCTGLGYIYSGTEYSNECYCGNTLASPGAVAASADCNGPCAGDSTTLCGGTYRLSVYKASSTTTSTTSTSKATTATSSAATTTASGAYVGCYVDQGAPRSLASYSTTSASMTNTLCQSTCAGMGYAYAGTEYADECYCGNTIGGSLDLTDSDCNMTCAGDSTKLCGGSYRLSVYRSGASTTTTSTAPASTATYSIADTYIGPSFLTGFTHQAIPDPTNGRVNYTDQAFALAKNLTFVSSDTLIMRADYTTVLSASGPGRNSVRIQSNKQYTTSVTIVNLRHMPQGCATWPAFWMTSSTQPWPDAGEIDIIEGVNDVVPNTSTLHTLQGCTMSNATITQTGTLETTDCYWQDNGNAGCGTQPKKANNYGPALNAVGGGWYITEKTSTHINIWFWARNDATVPASVLNGAGTIKIADLGEPYANFSNASCDMNTFFGPEAIIINLTLCGDWAGNVYPSTCPKTCVDHVNQDPADFANAYWDIASVRVYE
ncbi:hypothetical protein FRB94_008174 [Tulasnella sp. JGI-2019a]|nr:hypothetical protein FRB93_007698 [Tulasnella sp. JGI-2019a]KAG8996608.1 hypothetical protein FRB94_008174 [Tulasnella sp. JGI-2019a]